MTGETIPKATHVHMMTSKVRPGGRIVLPISKQQACLIWRGMSVWVRRGVYVVTHKQSASLISFSVMSSYKGNATPCLSRISLVL